MLQTPCEKHAPADSAGGAICPRCGRPVTSADATETMLETLAQLAQFGLDAEGRPLLESRKEGR